MTLVRRFVFRCLLTLASATAMASVAVAGSGFTESAIVFNTVCSKCHEAECSGRLSFAPDQRAAAGHLIRHYPGASDKDWLQRELLEILGYMKRKCAYYPARLPVPPMRVWGPELLAALATLPERYYFVPLGRLAPGRYVLQVELDGVDTRVSVQVVSERFEMLVDDCDDSAGGRLTVPVSVDVAGDHYFRMYPREPVAITGLRLEVAEIP